MANDDVITPKDRNTTSFGQDFLAQISCAETVDNESSRTLGGAIGTLGAPLLAGFGAFFARKATGFAPDGWIAKIRGVMKK